MYCYMIYDIADIFDICQYNMPELLILILIRIWPIQILVSIFKPWTTESIENSARS